MKCPKCQYERNPQDKECPSCGVIYEKWQNHSEKKQDKDEAVSMHVKEMYKSSILRSIIRAIIITCSIFAAIFILLLLWYILMEGNSRVRSYNSSAQADLRNVITVQEAYYKDHNSYASSIDELLGLDYGLYLSNNVVIKILSVSKHNFSMLAFHKSGDKIYIRTWPDNEVTVYKKTNKVRNYEGHRIN